MTAPRFNRRPDSTLEQVVNPPIPPVADFSFFRTGLSVDFTDLSTDADGRVVSWQWAFGDAAVLPVAAFAATPNGLQIIFADQSFDPDGTVVAWLWQFGDGSTSTSQNPTKTYAAAGSYTVRLQVTDNDGNLSVFHQQTITVSSGTGTSAKVQLGAYETMSGDTGWPSSAGIVSINCGIGKISPSSLLARINWLRQNGKTAIVTLAFGPLEDYLTNGVFDPLKWKSKVGLTNTPAIKAAVADAVADGILLGNILLDEPHNSKWGGYFDTNMGTKLDDLATYSHSIHPSLPCGTVGPHDTGEAAAMGVSVMDFIGMQYRESRGNLTTYITNAESAASGQGLKLYFSINILDGGIRAAELPSGTCEIPETGGNGTRAGNCRVTADQLEDWGLELGAATTGLLSLWRHDDPFFNVAANVTALAVVRAFLNTQPRGSLKRGI